MVHEIVNSFEALYVKRWVALKRAFEFKRALRGCGGPAGCLWAWWWLSRRGWRTGWCPQTDRPNKPRWTPAGPWQRSSGSAGPSWSPERFLAPDAGRAACGSVYVSKMTEPICTSHWCLVMSFWLKVCIYSHTRGVKLGLGLGFMQTSQVLPHWLNQSFSFFHICRLHTSSSLVYFS